jgi:hypothetical protein
VRRPLKAAHYRARTCCLPPFQQRRHPGSRVFRGSMAGLCTPLPTLRPSPRGHRRTARGRCGSLLLHRSGLSPPTPCRFHRRTESASVTGRNRGSAANGRSVPRTDSCSAASNVHWLYSWHAVVFPAPGKAKPNARQCEPAGTDTRPERANDAMRPATYTLRASTALVADSKSCWWLGNGFCVRLRLRTPPPWSPWIGIDGRHASERVVAFAGMRRHLDRSHLDATFARHR